MNSKDSDDFFILFTLTGKQENSRSRVAVGSQYNDYGFTLGALALKLSCFCDARVYTHVLNRGGKGVQSPGDNLFNSQRRSNK